MFVGSPIKHSEEELLAVGKKLKRNSIAVNIIAYGNLDDNRGKLDKFINLVNNNNNSTVVYVEPGFAIVDSLFSSTLMSQNQDQMQVDNVGGAVGGGNQGGMVPQSQFDRDLQRAFELSAEEDRKRKQTEDSKGGDSAKIPDSTDPVNDKVMEEKKPDGGEDELTEEQMLKMAMEMSKTEHDKQTHEQKQQESIFYI